MSIHLTKPTSMEATATHKAPINYVNCYPSQCEQDTGKHPVSSQETNPAYYKEITTVGFEPRYCHCPSNNS